MKKRAIFRKYVLYSVLVMVLSCAAIVVTLTMQKYKNTSMQFVDDGYMLIAANKEDGLNAINQQCYFSAGSNYRMSYGKAVVFTDASGNKVSVETENFLHYDNGSMNALSQSVIFDTDNVQPGDQLSYYSISSESLLRKAGGGGYSINNNGGSPLEISNFLWKIANDRYMVVSENIDLVVSENSEQSFSDYVELRYIDEGIAHIVTQSGTYSTISSDAYLLLDNGVRIYIGSKNVSDGENIIMNMSSMVVGSDDNIDVIPDEDYTIESDKQPQIVVNANDGESGKAGESGTEGETGDAGETGENGINGQNGSNGNPGKTGVDGDEGTQGESAPNSDVLYEQKKTPIFNPVELDVTAYGVTPNITFDENDCTVSDSWISIIETKTGIQVWKKVLRDTNNNILNNGVLNSADLICNTLSQNTEYAFAIYAKYIPEEGGSAITQILHQQLFKTDSLGVNLSRKYSTTNSIVVDVQRSDNSPINTISVVLMDDQMNQIGYARLLEDDDTYEYKEDTHSFTVSKLDPGIKLPLIFNTYYDNGTLKELQPDTVYYAQVILGSLLEGTGNTSLIPTSSFEPVKLYTLKRDPVLSAPSGQVQERYHYFIISPGVVSDIDRGITEYRYEILNAQTNEVVYSENVDSLKAITVSINENGINGILERDTPYVAQLVCQFNNNESIVEYRSPLSDVFMASGDAWPTINLNDKVITPTSLETTVEIIDTNGVLNVGDKITIEYQTRIEGSSDIIRETLTEVTLISNHINNGVIRIPIVMKGLMADCDYEIRVYKNDVLQTSGADILIGSDVISTAKYNPLLIGNIINNQNTQKSFDINVFFSTSLTDDQEDAYKAKNSSIWSNTTDPSLNYGISSMSGRSMTYIRFDIYDSKAITDNGTISYVPDGEPMARYVVQDTFGGLQDLTYASIINNFNYNTGSELFSKAFCTSTSIFEGYISDPQSIPLNFGINLTEDSFLINGVNIVTAKGYADEHKLFIKATVYDYVYGVGVDKPFGNRNEIPVGVVSSYDNSIKDQWIEVTTNPIVPPLPTGNIYEEVYKQEVLDNNVNYQSFKYTNISSERYDSLKTNEWNNVDIETGIGLVFRGPDELAKYCKSEFDINDQNDGSVHYQVCKKDSTGEINVLYDTGWIKYIYSDSSNPVMPSYTFFLYDGITDKLLDGITEKQTTRGEEFIIRTQIRMKGDNNQNKVYPANYSLGKDYIEDTIVIEKEKPTVKLVAYNGTVGQPGTVISYKYSDLDSTLKYSNDGNRNIVFSQYNNEGTLAAINGVYDSSDFGGTNFTFNDSETLSKNQGLNIEYALSDPNMFQAKGIFGEGYLSKKNVEIKSATVAYANNVVSVDFTYEASNKNDLLGVELFLEREDTQTHTHKMYTSEVLIPQQIDEDTNEPGKFSTTVRLTGDQIADVAGTDLYITIKALYDAGEYGYKHLYQDNGPMVVNQESTPTKIDTTYYLAERKTYLATSYTDYPADYYLSNGNSGILRNSKGLSFGVDPTVVVGNVDETRQDTIVLGNKTTDGKFDSIVDEFSYGKNENSGLYQKTSEGEYVPVEIKNVSASALKIRTNSIGDVSPVPVVEIIPGYSMAYVKININNQHTFNTSQPIKIYYKEKDAANWSEPVAVPWSASSVVEAELLNLINNTEYDIKFEAMNSQGAYVDLEYFYDNNRYSATNPYTFKTLEKYNFSFPEELIISPYPSTRQPSAPYTRDSKTMIYDFKIENVLRQDFRNSIETVTIEVLHSDNSSGVKEVVQTKDTVNSYKPLSIVYSAQDLVDDSVGTSLEQISKTIDFNWMPLDSKISNYNGNYAEHAMDATEPTKYYIKISYKYKNNIVDSEIREYTLSSWNKDSAMLIAKGVAKTTATVNSEGISTSNYGVVYSKWSGTDPNMIFPVDGNKKFEALAVMRFAESYNTIVNNNSVSYSKGEIALTTEGNQVWFKLQCTVGSDGKVTIQPCESIRTSSCSYGNQIAIDNLFPGANYYLEIYANVDDTNEAKLELDLSQLSSSSVDNNTLNDIIGHSNYSIITGKVATDKSDAIVASEVVFNQNAVTGKYWHTVTGSNLGNTKKLRITYVINNQTYEIVASNGTNLGDYFQMILGTDSYKLYIPNFDPLQEMYVNIQFYKETGDTVPQSSIVTSYTPEP